MYLSPQVPGTHSKMYMVIQNTYCCDNGLNPQYLDPTQEILRIQEWLDARFRYKVEQNQSHGLHKVSFVVQVMVTYASHIGGMSKKYTELARSGF